MELTPEVAQRQLCPMGPGFATDGHCAATRCMAWRHSKSLEQSLEQGGADRGFCGMAGRPAAVEFSLMEQAAAIVQESLGDGEA